MKKIDLHIHTVKTISDRPFTYSLDTFKRYVSEARLDAVAVTNHDFFDIEQFRAIQQSLPIVVFPGIEVNVDKGHVLMISDGCDLEDFDERSRRVSQKIRNVGDSVPVSELKAIFGDLGKYLIIPHYDKRPAVAGATLDELRQYISAGEVDSAKKFIRNVKDASKLTPVLFSDARMSESMTTLPTRQTYVDCGNLTLNALKSCFRDKSKVSLSEADGNKLWQVFDDGQRLSTGLNVLIGSRSSGKTFTLDEIQRVTRNVKYIRQFSLVQQSDAAYEKEFNNIVEKRRSSVSEEYLSGLKRVVEEVSKVDLISSDRAVDSYLETLLRSAEEVDRHDAYSKASLFNETDFPIEEVGTLGTLIGSVRQVIENVAYRDVIEKHLKLDDLKRLAVELMGLYATKSLENEKKKYVNSILRDVKAGLKIRTSATQVEDVDLYAYCMDRKRVARFIEMVNILKQEAVIFTEAVRDFKVEARRLPFTNATDVKASNRLSTSLADVFPRYGSPYEYLMELKKKETIPVADIYKLFVKVNFRILNRDGFEISGGERSEYRLLMEISDAQNYDVLLIDEPESSFDNLFLRSDVNNLLKVISMTMPVVVVTHNNTVGASIGPDFLLHTRKEMESGKVAYRLYSGYPSDKTLKSAGGKEIRTHEILMDSLEAGAAAYDARRESYEAIKD